MMVLFALSCAIAAPPNAEDFLLARAAEAASKGDRGALTEILRGWATLGPKGSMPAGLEREAAEALAWAEGVGRFRLFASRLEDRVRVGVHDPAALSGRIDAYAVVGGETLRITRAADEAIDRLEFRIDAVDAPVIVESVMTRFGTDVVLVRHELAPSKRADLPRVPDRNAFQPRQRKPADLAAAPENIMPWWLVAAGVAAALFAGAAIWQEARF